MIKFIIPIKMISYCQNHLPRTLIYPYKINYICFIYGHTRIQVYQYCM